jgi:4'-phosphopantetheinyl transferase EntD
MAVLSSNAHPEAWVEPPAVLRGPVHARATAELLSPGDPAGASNGPARREREFAAGRRCAARALLDAGARDLTVGVSPDRSPRWPAGFVGSITHSGSFAWAAVARDTDLRSLGIDSEPIFDEGALREAAPVVLDASEWRLAGGSDPATHATLVFSAKESLYKCLNPCTGVFFEFADVQFESLERGGPNEGIFVLCLRGDLAAGFPRGTRFLGRYITQRGHLHTAVELHRSA